MDTDDELRKLRTRIQAIRDDLDRQRPDPLFAGGASAVPFRVTQQINPAAGRTYGTGKGIKQKDTGTALVDDGTTEETIKTHNEKGIKAGVNAVVLCVQALGSWWTAAPDRCGNLV